MKRYLLLLLLLSFATPVAAQSYPVKPNFRRSG